MAKVRKRGKSWQIDYFDPNGRRVRRSYAKKKDAEAELGKRVSLKAEGRYLDVKKELKTTFGELAGRYDENYQHQGSYQRNKRAYIENFKAHFGEDTRLGNIRYADLETYRNQLRSKLTRHGTLRSEASVNREMSCLHHLFTKAVEWEMVEQNPFGRGKSLLLKENNERVRFLSEDEIGRLLAEVNHIPHLRRIVVCALNSGMRKGEILSLRWPQIRNGFIYLTMTKTKNARQIPINDTLAALFDEIKREQRPASEHVFTYRQNEHRAKEGSANRNRLELVRIGSQVKDVKTAFKAACKRAGIEDFTFHDLRHTFASHVLMRGASIKDVQELLGHKTMKMTLRYAHLTQEHKKKAVNLLNGLTALSGATCHKTVTPRKTGLAVSG